MDTEAFFDTNVLVYLLDPGPKADIAESLIAAGGTISVQVLNEFVSVGRRKYLLQWPEVQELLAGFHARLRVEPLTNATQARAVEIAEAHRLDIYDANILAAAELAGCSTVYTEDMQHGQRIGGLTIHNPFVEA